MDSLDFCCFPIGQYLEAKFITESLSILGQYAMKQLGMLQKSNSYKSLFIVMFMLTTRIRLDLCEKDLSLYTTVRAVYLLDRFADCKSSGLGEATII